MCVSDWAANHLGHPVGQLLFLIAAALAWFAGASMNALSVALSLIALTLTQMVLNQQRRHDAALHLKLDELIRSQDGARDELAGVEDRSEAEIRAMVSRPAS